jgi:hypothetical protein
VYNFNSSITELWAVIFIPNIGNGVASL